jgi:hypothetical protein
MATELDRMFAALARDAGQAQLPPAAAVRRRADRRRAIRSVAGLAAVAVLVSGVAVGARLVLADPSRPPAPPVSSSSPAPARTPQLAEPSLPPPDQPPTSPPSSAGGLVPGMPTSVPARALLTAGDANTAEFERLNRPVGPTLFCPGTDYPSSAQAGVRATVRLLYRGPGEGEEHTPRGTVTDTVTVYRGDGARQFMAELRDNVRQCPQNDPWENRVRSFDGPGDDAVLVERSWSRSSRYEIAVRIGDAVALVKSEGYEMVAADRAESEDFARTAAERLADWRG